MSKGGHNRIKDSTNDCKGLDILLYQREGKLTEEGKGYYNTYWSSRSTGAKLGNIGVETSPEYVRLIYTVTDKWSGQKSDIDYKVLVSWTPCNYGGKRAWFVCKCGRRARKLYLKNNYFYCRHCQQLNYYSQQQSKSDQLLDGIREKICFIQKQLKESSPDHNSYWVPKPRGMHHKKYERLIDTMHKLQQKHEQVFASECSRRFGMTI